MGRPILSPFLEPRLKDNAAYEVVKECAVTEKRYIRSDRVIRFSGEKAQSVCPCLLEACNGVEPARGAGDHAVNQPL
jgi:hypothetical protein